MRSANVCTHEQVWLDDGILHPDTCEIECPMHEARFDLRTGAATHEPSYVVRVEATRYSRTALASSALPRIS